MVGIVRLPTLTHRVASRALLFGLGLAAVLVSPVIRAQKSPLAQAAVTRAQEHLAAQRYPDAIRELQGAVRYEPRFALGWYLLASTYRRAADCDRAIAAYRRYSELRPAEAEPHYGIGRCLEIVGDPSGAVAEYLRYAGQEKKPMQQTFVADARKRADALNLKLAVAAKQPSSPEPPGLADADRLRQQRHLTEAIVGYRKWLGQHPRDETVFAARANAELGSLLVITNDLPSAVAALREAVRLQPAEPRAWYNLAFALRHEGQLADAVGASFRYVTFKPTDPDAYYGLGLSLSKLGRGDEALAALRTYVKLEKRPAERRWVAKARAELARLAARPRGKERLTVEQAPTTGPGNPPLQSKNAARKPSPNVDKNTGPDAGTGSGAQPARTATQAGTKTRLQTGANAASALAPPSSSSLPAPPPAERKPPR